MTVALGFMVDKWLGRVQEDFRRKPPEGVTAEDWAALLAWPETYGGTIHWLGLLERCFFFTILRTATWQFILGWLFFKLGCYWGIWRNIFRGGKAEICAEPVASMVAQNRRGNALAFACLFGTLGNLLAALLGTFCSALGMWIFHV
jgi:hypothetical protein